MGIAEKPGPTNRSAREVGRRWSPALVRGGWTPLSNVFLEQYRKLGMTSVEAMLVAQLMYHKWDEAAPRPSFRTLAGRMGLTDIAVRAHARSLEKKGLLKRISRVGQANLFDLSPLFAKLERAQLDVLSLAEARATSAEGEASP